MSEEDDYIEKVNNYEDDTDRWIDLKVARQNLIQVISKNFVTTEAGLLRIKSNPNLSSSRVAMVAQGIIDVLPNN